MRRRIGESLEEYRLRDAEAHRRRYVPTGRPRGRPRTRSVCSKCGDAELARGLCYRHYRAMQRAAGTPWALEGNKSFKARAARHGVSYEPVNRRRVFERDAWICGICGRPVAVSEASLDHIVPMSKGGAHSYSNVQCSHLSCNIKKGSRLG